jgi:hypothetical protein
MKFRHKVERININGLKEFSVNYYLCDELLIGRGGSCHIRLSSRLVALTHAKLYINPDQRLVVEDLNTDCGTRVNDVLVKKQVLKEGDRIKVGDVTFTLFNDGTYWGFHEVVEEKPEEDRDEVVRSWQKGLDLSRFYPSFLSFSALLVAAVALVAFVEPYVGINQRLWSSGPISNPHKMIEKNCLACHAKPFEPVKDSQCAHCHKLSEHAVGLHKLSTEHPDFDFKCEDCHHEHNGTQPIIESSSHLCTQCHGQLNKLYPETKHPIVSSFAKHPEFAVTIPQYGPSGASAAPLRISFSDREHLKDSTRLKLNHMKHLEKGIRSPTGPKTLECMDCHKLSDDLKTVVPVTFEANCASCHPLGFDERLQTKQVPHGETDVVYNYLVAEYAKLFLNTEREGGRQEFVKRFKPGRSPDADTPTMEFTKQFVEQESRNAENELLTRTACFLCHQVKRADVIPPGKSQFQVLKPNMPSIWMPETIFSHGTHQEVTCESCHRKVRQSKDTTDVLLPTISDCRECHASSAREGKVISECIMCHSYHKPLLLSDKAKRAIRSVVER